jgi:molybdenum cofactor biosynthesis enzyme MoaA
LKALLRSGISKEVIKRKIQEGVWIRPEQHFLNDLQVKHNDFQMSQVGG